MFIMYNIYVNVRTFLCWGGAVQQLVTGGLDSFVVAAKICHLSRNEGCAVSPL